ncbi:MAG: fimbria/pilus outer membrane usher protein [Morganella sp. (in: enterobacteria)]
MKTQHCLPILIIAGLWSYPREGFTEEFDTSLLAGESAKGDISRLYQENTLPSGEQLMDVHVNNTWKGQFTVLVREDNNSLSFQPEDINKLGLNLSDNAKKLSAEKQLVPANNLTSGLTYHPNKSTLRLDLFVPQIGVKTADAGYIDPELWDHGQPAFILGYNVNYYNYKQKKNNKQNNDSIFATVNTGLNLGVWQFRDESVYSSYSGGHKGWKNNSRYLYRPISRILSALTLGDFYTPPSLFGSFKFRGVSLATDMNMLPPSGQGFAPIIRGVAQTNALVSIYQNGNLIFQENVPPGEFMFRDIQPTGGSGDFSVIIQEADGRKESFTVPFSAVPDMLKEGIYNYSLTAGQARPENTHYRPEFIQGEFRYGLNNTVTLYTGAIAGKDYRSVLAGSAWNLSFGALSVDVTQADADFKTGRKSGQSYRVAYSKFVSTTSTNLTLATYRYSTGDFYSFTDAIYQQDNYRAWDAYRNAQENTPDNTPGQIPDLMTMDAMRGARAKNTFTVNLNQYLGENRGVIYISGTHRDYWNSGGNNREYQLGYSNSYNDISYTVSASRTRNYDDKNETRFYLNVSVPISVFGKNASLSSGIYATDSRYQQTTVNLSGTAGKDDLVNYTLSGSNQNGGSNLAGANLSYRNPYSTLSGSLSEGNDYRQAGAGAKGTIVAIPGHIAMSGDTGNTYTIIDAPQADNRMVNSDKASLTNSDGVVLMTQPVPYRANSYTLSDTEKSSGAEVTGNIGQVSPYKGAVSYIRMETDSRQTFILRASRENGGTLPFGTEVTDEQHQPLGYVGQSGLLYLKSGQLPSLLVIKLTADGKQQCIIRNPLVTSDKNHNICR